MDIIEGGYIMNNELRIRVEKRMAKESLTWKKLGEILGISRTTLHRFSSNSDEGISRRNLLKLESYVNDDKSYAQNIEMVNLGQVRVEKNVYDYIKRAADRDQTDIPTVLRKVLNDVVDNDYLWKSMTDHLMVTERAVRDVIQSLLIPFIKTQDKVLDNIDAQTFYLEEMIGRYLLKNYLDPEAQVRYQNTKQSLIELFFDVKYDRKKD